MNTTHSIDRIHFDVLDETLISSTAALEIKNTEDLEHIKLGARPNEPCATCSGDIYSCPGHFGYIRLAEPLFNIIFFKHTINALSQVCINCYHPVHEKEKTCSQCGFPIPNLYTDKLSKELRIRMKFSIVQRRNSQHVLPATNFITPTKARNILLQSNNPRLASMIMTLLPVLPTIARPSLVTTDGKISKDELTHAYNNILRKNKEWVDAIQKKRPTHIRKNIMQTLQRAIDKILMDTKAGKKVSATQPDTKGFNEGVKSIRDRIAGKRGRIRLNIQGKRCNFTARTVASCDANLSVDQIGLPISIAQNLTFPERCTRLNIKWLEKIIANDKANSIERQDGSRYNIVDIEHTIQLVPGDIVHRQLMDDDLVAINRQPSLHKYSIFGLRVKILPFSTVRINVSVTTPLNADFDGDELNIHVPQGLEAKAELQELMMINKLAISAHNESPLIGLVQDGLLGIHILSRLNVFLQNDETMNMMMHMDVYEIPTPAILIPNKNIAGVYTGYWTGKQIISMTLPPDINYTEGDVIIRDSYICTGELTEKHVGRKYNSICRTIIKQYNGEVFMKFINNTQQIANQHCQNNGFSVGLEDCFTTKKTKQDIAQKLQNVEKETQTLFQDYCRQHKKKSIFEININQYLTGIRDKVAKEVVKDVGENNNFNLMSKAGSKGSPLNLTQIAGSLGQQSFYNQRIPEWFKNRTLPHYTKYDMGANARGFVASSYMKGLNPQEFWFHAQVGRIGLISTSLETRGSGYQSRKFIKNTEALYVAHDNTVRDTENRLVQLKYGHDGCDISKSTRIDLTRIGQ